MGPVPPPSELCAQTTRTNPAGRAGNEDRSHIRGPHFLHLVERGPYPSSFNSFFLKHHYFFSYLPIFYIWLFEHLSSSFVLRSGEMHTASPIFHRFARPAVTENHTPGARTTGTYCLPVPEATSPRSRCQQGWLLLNLLQAYPPFLGCAGNP